MKIRINPVTMPTQRADGSALNPATDLQGYRVYTKLAGDSFVQLGGLHPVSETDLQTGDLPAGDYTVRLEWVDNFNQMVGLNKSVTISTPVVPAAPAAGDFGLSVVP